MPNPLLRRHGSDDALAHRHQDEALSPYRMMRDLLRWDPFREMLPAMYGEQAAFAPAFEVAEHKDRFVFSADLPGVKDKDVDIKLTGNRLTISGKRESEHEDKTDTFYACERSYGTFTRTFTLPSESIDLEHVSANLKDGVLSIVIPKRATQESKQIAVNPTEKAKA